MYCKSWLQAAQAPAYTPWIGWTYNVSFQYNFILLKTIRVDVIGRRQIEALSYSVPSYRYNFNSSVRAQRMQVIAMTFVFSSCGAIHKTLPALCTF